MQHKPIEILIVDDHPMVIEGLKALLDDEEGILVKECFTDGKSTLTYLDYNVADVILLDVNLPDINGVDMVQPILDRRKDIKILVLSTYNEGSIITKVINNGVKGYLLKNVGADELTTAIYRVFKGGVYYAESVQIILEESAAQKTVQLPKLTRREKHVLNLIAQGKRTNDIAEELFISPLTVETHRRNLMQKLKVSNAAAMVRFAMENHLI
ncbi:response regulator [Flagellimonas meridianipacifica]|uniref:DNA-binding NarL/FixJ family response regulator n=1 Tax=Flagellimonas meridianipacifica TaxID=1080225 RepID=A0A2T0MJL4_9FLAO|nr:response regulator transcription factor [Allomuricauda pacifica]PRX57696.1 DNA-binding NarL/FixJ family response regulator [Allomuricauda pacifica]